MTFVICPSALLLFLIRGSGPPYGWLGFFLVWAGSYLGLFVGARIFATKLFLESVANGPLAQESLRLRQELDQAAKARGFEINWDNDYEWTPEEEERFTALLKEVQPDRSAA